MGNAYHLVLFAAVASALASRAVSQPLHGPDTVVVRNGTLTLRGLLYRPSGRGPFPAVLYNHGSGPASDPRRPALVGPAFARRGYILLYLFRRGAGLSADQGTHSGELMRRAFAASGHQGRNEMQLRLLDAELGDVLAGLAFLRTRPEVDGHRLVLAGHSFGGSLTLVAAERDTGVQAAVVFGAAAASWEASPELRARLTTAVGRTSAPVYFLYAANDFSVAPGKALAAELRRLRKPHRLTIYPPVGRTPSEGHTFVHRRVSAWAPHVVAFLSEHRRR